MSEVSEEELERTEKVEKTKENIADDDKVVKKALESEKEDIEQKRQEILANGISKDEELVIEDNVGKGKVKKLEEIDLKSINYKEFEKIDQEHIDLYYILNDNKDNMEFLDEELVKISKKEEEIKALKAQEKEEFDFQMEELTEDVENEVKVDLTGIIDDLEKV